MPYSEIYREYPHRLFYYKNIHMNGVEFYKQLKETTDYYKLDLKAVFISSKYETEKECLDVGGLDFIRVPFDTKDVIARIQKILLNSVIVN